MSRNAVFFFCFAFASSIYLLLCPYYKSSILAEKKIICERPFSGYSYMKPVRLYILVITKCIQLVVCLTERKLHTFHKAYGAGTSINSFYFLMMSLGVVTVDGTVTYETYRSVIHPRPQLLFESVSNDGQ